VKILEETVIKVENVGIEFSLNKEKVDSLKVYLIKFLKRDLKFTKFWALKNVSFEVKKGSKLGIIGLNGAGKSTLLKLISGVIKPTEGNIEIKGTIVPLLELGAGFDPEYTGRENIFLKGALLGYSKSYLESKFDEIVKFSELENFIDVPLKNYSTGMNARLAFSIATIANTLGGGKPLLQRLGDLRKGRRSTWRRLERSNVKPTFNCVTPGDIAMALPHRVVVDIIEGLEALDKVMPGVSSDSTLIYAPEIKLYAMRLEMDKKMKTRIDGLYAAGDGAGVSRGIVGAAATGIIAARDILNKNGK